jgi:hypothetical protein
MRRIRGGARIILEECRAATIAFTVRTETFTSKNVGDGWEAIACLCGWDMVDMRGAGEVGWLVCNMPRERMRLMSSCERLVKGRGLNYPFVCELLVGRCNNAQSRRRFPLRRTRSLCPESSSQFSFFGTFHWCIAWLGRLL